MSEKDTNSRNNILIRTSWISMIGNFLLSASKIVVGFWSGSLAVLSDGIDSASDVIISFVMLFTAQIMNRPPNSKYVYGYEKAESLATKILSFIMFYAGIEMLIAAISSLHDSHAKEMPAMPAVYVTLASIVGKFILSLYQYRQGKRANSSMLKANAMNMRNDIIISVGVLVGLIFTFILKLPILDSIVGLIISLFIIRSSVKIFMDSSVELMDGVQDVSVYKKIFDAVDKVPGAINPHRVRSRQIGNMYMIALDIEADGFITLNEAHDIAEAVERSIKESVENVYDIVVHVEPVGEHHPKEKFGVDRKMLE